MPDERPYGEAWDLSSQVLHVSRVLEGPYAGKELNDIWKQLNHETTTRTGFPLLVKWLECRELLSLQVHPDDQMAQRVLNEPFGKSEAWVVIATEPTARVYAGLKPGVTREYFIKQMKNGALTECLHSFVPSVGDCISLPAGTVHAAGGGLLVAEVQQSSDATFRLYDWDRIGLDGLPRPLQIDRALEAINWEQGEVSPVIPVKLPVKSTGVRAELLVDGSGFRLERYIVDQTLALPHVDELTIWMVLNGRGALSNPETGYRHEFTKGATTLVPPGARNLAWESLDDQQTLTLLCTRLRQVGI